jgi:DNA-binding protein YbaB
MTDPHSLITSLEQRTADIMSRAEATQAEVAAVTGTATSEDGAVTVTVNATGALQDVTFGRTADRIPKENLGAVIMATARRAQASAAKQVTTLMAPLIGTNSEAMQMLQQQLPSTEQPPPAKHSPVAVYNDERHRTETARPPRPSRPAAEDDEVEHDYDQRGVLKKKRR